MAVRPSFRSIFSTAILSLFKARDSSGTERTFVDSDGYLYQRGVKITRTAAQINAESNTFTTPVIADGDAGVTLTSANQTNGSATVTIPNIGDAADSFVMNDTAATLTNKTLTAPKIATTGYIADGGGDEYLKFVEASTPITYIQITSGNTTVAPKLQGGGETNTDLLLSGAGTGNVQIADGTDNTKIVDFEVSGATAGTKSTIIASQTTNRSITLPDADGTLVTTDGTQTLTNKTLTTPVIATFYQDAGKTKLMTAPNTASDTLVALAATQTLTNKHLTSAHLTTPLIEDGDTGVSITSADQTNASPTVTIPDIADAADTFVMCDTTQTLTLKTLTSPTLTTPKIVTTGSINDAGGDEYLKFVEATTPVTYIQITSGDTTVAPKVQGAGETNTDLHLLGTGTGNVKISDGTDPTKILQFELAGATTGKYCQFTISQADDTIITFPTATATLATVGGTENLTGKTLTSPKIDDGDADVTITSANQTNASATVTIPDIADAADTFVMCDTEQTLTLKSLTDSVNTWTLSAHNYGGAADNWTLSAGELKKPCHKPTNASGAVNAIVADTIRPYWFINATGQALTVKTAAGTGITIANGKVACVMSDGVNVIRMSGDA